LNLLNLMQGYESAMPYSAIQEGLKNVDRVTLYRTLESLTGQGIIHKAFQEKNEIYYAICGTQCSKSHHEHNHVHFKCSNCDAVTCEKPTENIEISVPGVDIHKISIHIEGVCKSCKEEILP